ncbi:hypothetical protein PPERSA_06215 [Pseudocohnilembus persalinus]|uniref:Uncharacterized protein n=1 Tax=Pseudocohnilembus persalinus TaxID=266149 RepID=A0A0V0R1J2_PSEPJ|nr:hypothetical protein PPERSA_06215 [Pseudocohnilembus persalinus]|eukprot:KRX08037.1 hypothetical protein PPERSA_06215 [Pseudocohnilembus persalinus]
MNIDQQIQELEKWVFQSESKEAFLKSLISDTESYYFFNLLDSLEKCKDKLSPQQETQLKKFKKFKSVKSKSIQLRYLFKIYDNTKDETEKKQTLQKINKKLFKIKFNHSLPSHLRVQNTAYDSLSNQVQQFNFNENMVQQQQQMPQQRAFEQVPQQMQMQQQQQQFKMEFESDSSDNEEHKQESEKMKSEFDENLTKIDKYLEDAYQSQENFYKLNVNAIPLLKIEKLIESQLPLKVYDYFFNNCEFSSVSNEILKAFIDKYVLLLNKNQKKKMEFNQNQLFAKLTLDQLEFLRQNFSDFILNQTFVSELYQKQFYSVESPDLKSKEGQQQYLEILRKKYQWTKDSDKKLNLPVKFKSICDQILFEILNFGITINHYDFDLFMEFLKNPIEQITHCTKQQNKKYQERLKVYSNDKFWYNVNKIEPSKWKSQNELIETYLIQYYRTNKSKQIQPFEEYFDEVYLNRLLIKAQLFNGETDIQGVSDYFSPQEIYQLNNEKTLKICAFNQHFFEKNQEVKVYVEIQNVAKFVVKIFEIQAENYFLKTRANFDNNLDLDGLTASEEQTFDFSTQNLHPCKKVIREFKFETISKKEKGIFVVEFFGNDIASRFVIQKGQLSVIQRKTAAGNHFRIIDQNGEVQVSSGKEDKVGIWVEKQFYSANKKGEVIIPFLPSGQQVKQLILVSGDLSCLQSVTLLSEMFNFQCEYFYNQEQFLMGQKATVMISPSLHLQGQILPVTLIEDVQIQITTRTEDDIPNSTKFEKVKFKLDQDFEAAFQVPAKLKSIQIQVDGQIPRAVNSEGGQEDDKNKIQVSNSQMFYFENYRGQNQFISLFLKKNEKKEYEIHLLGKNGEPQKGQEINLFYQHFYLQEKQRVNLVTNEKGAVILGKLENIIGIEAECLPTNQDKQLQEKWAIFDASTNGGIFKIPNQFRILKEEQLIIPYIQQLNLPLNEENFQLLQVLNGNQIIKNCFKNLSFGKEGLIVSGLNQGSYQLKINKICKKIDIKVISGKKWNENSLFDEKSSTLYDNLDSCTEYLKPFQVESFKQEKKQDSEIVKIKVNLDKEKAKNLRFHAFAFQLVPWQHNSCGQWSPFNANRYNPFLDKKISVKEQPAKFMSNRYLASELAYIYDRKQAPRFTGNSLSKPQILLKKNFKSTTQTVNDDSAPIKNDFEFNVEENYNEAALDASFSDDLNSPRICEKKTKVFAKKMPMAKGKMCLASSSLSENQYNLPSQLQSFNQGQKINNFINFLQNPAFFKGNLVPNENGEIEFEIPRQLYSQLQLVACSPYHCSVSYFELEKNEKKGENENEKQNQEIRDLRQKSDLEMNKFYSIFRFSEKKWAGKKFDIEDITSTEFSMIDSLQKLADLISELGQFNRVNNQNSARFKVLKGWQKMSPQEKLSNYNEYQSMDFNFFVYIKDPEFFEQVVKGYLQNKLEKQLVDYFLLGEFGIAIDLYNHVERFQQLNALELCLIIFMLVKEGQESSAKEILAHMENSQKLVKKNIEREKKVFDIALNQIDKQDFTKKTNAGRAMIQQATNLNQNIRAPPQIQQQIQQVSNYNVNSLQRRQMSEESFCSDSEDDSYLEGEDFYGEENDEEEEDLALYENNFENQEDFFGGYQQQQQQQQQSYGGRRLYQQNVNRMERRSSALRLAGTKFDPLSQNIQKQRYNQLQSYNPVGITNEYSERHYSTGESNSQHLVPMNQFWIDFAQHILETKSLNGFLSNNILFAANHIIEMTFVIAVSDMPSEVPEHQQSTSEKKLTVIPGGNLLLFTKEIKETVGKFRNDILINQRFFDPKDKFSYEDDNTQFPINKDLSQFVINKIIGCEVIISNFTAAQQQLQVFYQVPQGSIPVNVIEYTKSQLIVIPAFNIKIITFYFYFPEDGKFKLYPANVSKDGQVYSVAKDYEFEVQKELKVEKLDTINQILTKGDKEDILKFIEQKNILNPQLFNFSDIYHLLSDKDFYTKLIKILKQKRIYNHTVFSYSIYHNDRETLREFLNTPTEKAKINKIFKFIESDLIKLPRNFSAGGLSLQLLEYHPLLNSRVHLLNSDKANITNKQLKNTYKNFLEYLSEKGGNSDQTDKLGLVYYLLLQERVEEAIKIFQKISVQPSLGGQLQYDYMAAYLDFYQGYPNFTRAREIIEKYLDYPIIAWRNLFYEMANQLGEYDGEELQEDELLAQENLKEKNRAKENEKNAEKETLLECKIEGKDIIMSHKNLEEGQDILVQYFVIDLEIFFSKKPFLSSIYDDFSYLIPSQKSRIKANPQKGDEMVTTQIKIDQKLENLNVFVQVSNGQKKSGGIYFSTSLQLQLFEQYGQLKITDQNQKALSKVYIKAYAKYKDGQVKFHKDGYTDLRGKFDYLSLNTDKPSQIDKFSLFIMSDDLGCLIKEAQVPSILNKTGDTVQLRAHGWQAKYKTKMQSKPMMKKY